MSNGAVSRRYAEAVFSIALENKSLEAWRKDLETIRVVLSNPQLVLFLENPKVTNEEKKRLVTSLLRKRVQPAPLNFVFLLIERHRVGIAGHVAIEYQRMMDEHLGIATAEVTTAVPLSAEQLKGVVSRLTELTGKKIKLETKVDATIIGGIIIKIGDRLIDGSVATRLANLSQAMA
jgi:F-type H+-transporting ATPase subunit delta